MGRMTVNGRVSYGGGGGALGNPSPPLPLSDGSCTSLPFAGDIVSALGLWYKRTHAHEKMSRRCNGPRYTYFS